jgi:hypothetical protein
MTTALALKVMQAKMVKGADKIDPKTLHFIGQMMRNIMQSLGSDTCPQKICPENTLQASPPSSLYLVRRASGLRCSLPDTQLLVGLGPPEAS